jgi:hypothetical protein
VFQRLKNDKEKTMRIRVAVLMKLMTGKHVTTHKDSCRMHRSSSTGAGLVKSRPEQSLRLQSPEVMTGAAVWRKMCGIHEGNVELDD